MEVESLRICFKAVERFLNSASAPPELKGVGWGVKYVLARALHSVGDTMILRLIRLSPNFGRALRAAEAIERLVADVGMVEAGVRGRCAALGLPVAVASTIGKAVPHKPEGAVAAGAEALVRAEAFTPETLVINGNAPSFLETLLNAMRSGLARPYAIIATPPGFVKAPSVKDRLVREVRDTPYLTVLGSRGGSPVAVAVANAILDIRSGRAEELVRRVRYVIHS